MYWHLSRGNVSTKFLVTTLRETWHSYGLVIQQPTLQSTGYFFLLFLKNFDCVFTSTDYAHIIYEIILGIWINVVSWWTEQCYTKLLRAAKFYNSSGNAYNLTRTVCFTQAFRKFLKIGEKIFSGCKYFYCLFYFCEDGKLLACKDVMLMILKTRKFFGDKKFSFGVLECVQNCSFLFPY